MLKLPWYYDNVTKHYSPAHHPLEINYDSLDGSQQLSYQRSTLVTFMFPLHQFMFQRHPPPFIHIKSMNLRAENVESAYGCLSPHLRKRWHPHTPALFIASYGTGIQLEKFGFLSTYHLWWFLWDLRHGIQEEILLFLCS